MGNQRRVHSAEFKLEAVRRVERHEQPLTQIARELDVSPTLLQLWRKQLGTPSENAGPLSLEEENRRLRREVASLKEDRDILKKAQGSLRRKLGEVRIRRAAENRTWRTAFVPFARSFQRRLLRMALAPDESSRTR